MATYAIGDIQGCFNSFQRLLEKIDFDPQCDQLWLVGDLVNRGPASLEVLRFVKNMGQAAVTVLGNHDLHVLAIAAGISKSRAGDTLQQILDAADAEALLDWLRQRPLLHRENNYLMVHAGLLPQWTATQAEQLAQEVTAVLGGAHYREFLAQMYGNQPDQWQDNLQGVERLRLIINAMTRLRFCTANGKMEFDSKGEADQPPPGLMPWFEVPTRASRDTIIICGHWSALGLKITDNLIAVDSGCIWGRQLTALRLEDRQLFQVDCSATVV